MKGPRQKWRVSLPSTASHPGDAPLAPPPANGGEKKIKKVFGGGQKAGVQRRSCLSCSWSDPCCPALPGVGWGGDGEGCPVSPRDVSGGLGGSTNYSPSSFCPLPPGSLVLSVRGGHTKPQRSWFSLLLVFFCCCCC